MELSSVDLNLLVVLDALLDTASVKEAAHRVALSPSATSHALARLRDLLDDPVLVRAGSRMVPTPRAERLRPRVRQALDAVRGALSPEAEADPASMQRGFRVATNDYGELCVLTPLSGALAAEAPGVDINVLPSREVVLPLRRSEIDLAVGVFSDLSEDVVSEPLWKDTFVCVVRAEHPAAQAELTLDAFLDLDHLLVAPRGRPGGVVDAELTKRGLARRVSRTASSFVVAPHFVAGSDLILTISARIARRFARPLGLTILPPPLELPSFTVRVAWHRRATGDAEHRWFRQRILAAPAD